MSENFIVLLLLAACVVTIVQSVSSGDSYSNIAEIVELNNVGPCTDGDTLPSLDCYRYKVCESGSWVTKKCPDNQIFSDGQCRFYWEAQCNPARCNVGSSYAYAADCTKYIYCNENNDEEVLNCPKSKWLHWLITYRFDPGSSKCKWDWKWIKCNGASAGEYEEDGIAHRRPKRSDPPTGTKFPDDCIEGDSKADLKPGVCSTYMYCLNSKWTRRFCPKGQYYHETKQICTNEPCSYAPVPGKCEDFVTSDKAVQKCEFGMRFDKVTHQCLDFAEANCAEVECDGTERKNHPYSCSKYLQCVDQQWEEKSCGWFKNTFDMASRECVLGWWHGSAICRYDAANCTEGSTTPLKDCGQYLTCIDGTLHINSCFWPMKFDRKSGHCKWWGANCL